MSPTQRTLAYLRKEGWLAGITEKWNQYAKIRQDLFGFVDIVAVNDKAVLFVQCTSASNMSERANKIAKNAAALKIIHHVWSSIWLVGWKKGRRGPRIMSFQNGAWIELVEFPTKVRKKAKKKKQIKDPF